MNATSGLKRHNSGDQRRQRILISAAALLIWCLPCERDVQHENDPAKVCHKEGYYTQMASNYPAANQPRQPASKPSSFGPRALGMASMRDTWEPILHPGSDLPPEKCWGGTGLLVRI